MKLRTTMYDLYCHKGEYEKLVKALNDLSISKETTKDFDGRIYFVMPEGKVKIFLRDGRSSEVDGGKLEGKVTMEVVRTTRREPKYINLILERLVGKETYEGFKYASFTPEERIIGLDLGRS